MSSTILTDDLAREAEKLHHGIMKPGTLVTYKGGGYDGCFWEWNTFLVGKDNEIFDVYSSGYAGVFDWTVKPEAFRHDRFLKAVEEADSVLDLNTDEGRKEINEYIACYAYRIARKLEDLEEGYTVCLKCCECNRYVGSTEEAFFDRGYDHGDGGVGVVNDHLVCEDCYNALRCDNCGGRASEGSFIEVGGEQTCSSCISRAEREMDDEARERYDELQNNHLWIVEIAARLVALTPQHKDKIEKQEAELVERLTEEKNEILERYL
jgi:hypothetical protein